MHRRTQLLISLLLAAGLFGWFLWGVDLRSVGVGLRAVRPGYLAVATLLSVATMAYRAWRWRYLVTPLADVRIASLISCVFMGSAVLAMLPGRVGELAKPMLLGRRERISRTAVLGTVVLERMLDMLAVLVLLALYLTFFPSRFGAPGQVSALNLALRAGGWLVFVGLVGVVVLGVTAVKHPERTTRRLRALVEKLPGEFGARGWRLLSKFGLGLTGPLGAELTAMSHERLWLGVTMHTGVLWAGICGVHLLLFRAFGLALPFYAVFPLISMVVVGLMVPVPAAAGSYHAAVQIGLTTLLGVTDELATGYALVSHAVAYLPSVLIGLILLAREGLSLATVEQG